MCFLGVKVLVEWQKAQEHEGCGLVKLKRSVPDGEVI